MAGAIDIRGLDRVLQRLDRTVAALQTGLAIQLALQAGALIVEADAKRRAPYRTGNLRRSIHTDVRGNEARVGTDVAYARRIEYGFAGREDRLGRRYNQAAQPYLRPAAEANRGAVIAEVNRTLRAQLERIGS